MHIWDQSDECYQSNQNHDVLRNGATRDAQTLWGGLLEGQSPEKVCGFLHQFLVLTKALKEIGFQASFSRCHIFALCFGYDSSDGALWFWLVSVSLVFWVVFNREDEVSGRTCSPRMVFGFATFNAWWRGCFRKPRVSRVAGQFHGPERAIGQERPGWVSENIRSVATNRWHGTTDTQHAREEENRVDFILWMCHTSLMQWEFYKWHFANGLL